MVLQLVVRLTDFSCLAFLVDSYQLNYAQGRLVLSLMVIDIFYQQSKSHSWHLATSLSEVSTFQRSNNFKMFENTLRKEQLHI